MQSFQISAAKHLNREFSRDLPERRRGTVFPDRYHEELITTPKQARHALNSVINNWRKHREDRGRTWNVDPFSSGISFTGWKYFEDKTQMWSRRATYDPLVVYLPTTWLLTTGWQKFGLLEFDEVPSAARR